VQESKKLHIAFKYRLTLLMAKFLDDFKIFQTKQT